MKKLLLSLMAVFAALSMSADDTTVSLDFSAQGYANGTAIEAVTLDANVSIAFDKGTNSNGPKYYTTGTAVRMYGANSMTLTTASGVIKGIELTFSSGEGTNAIEADCGTFAENAWSGAESAVKLTIAGTSGHRRVKTISVTYGEAGSSDPVAVESVALTDAEGNAVSQYTMLTVGESMQLKAVVNPSDATNKKVTWEVMQNEEVISLVNGKVTALKAGQAAVVVTTEDGEFQAATTIFVSAPMDGTIAEFIEAEGKACYLTGVVSGIASATYGNFTLTDESGSIYVYGCLNADGESKKFAELGISEGDKIKVLASEYKMYTPKEGDPYPEAVNVVFVENFGPVGPAAEYTFQIEDHGTTFTITPSDEEVMYYVELLPAEYDAETVAAYFDGNFEEMGEGLEYFQGVQTQSYEDDWYCEVGEEGKIWVCAVSADYKRVSELFGKEFTVTDTPTGVASIMAGQGKAVLFNLAGQKVGANAKGLIISGGKVVLK